MPEVLENDEPPVQTLQDTYTVRRPTVVPLQAAATAAEPGLAVTPNMPRWLQNHVRIVANREAEVAGQNPIWHGAKWLGETAIESIPGGLGPYGIGDAITLGEAAFGRTFDGLHLSGFERLIYLGASLIPVLPARPIITVYRTIDEQITKALVDHYAQQANPTRRAIPSIGGLFQQFKDQFMPNQIQPQTVAYRQRFSAQPMMV